jgi:hypothetical protein
MNSVTADQGRLRKALDIASFRRSFQTVQKHNLAYRGNLGLMLINHDTCGFVDTVELFAGRESLFVDLPVPKVARNGKQVRVPEDRAKRGVQNPILAE